MIKKLVFIGAEVFIQGHYIFGAVISTEVTFGKAMFIFLRLEIGKVFISVNCEYTHVKKYLFLSFFISTSLLYCICKILLYGTLD